MNISNALNIRASRRERGGIAFFFEVDSEGIATTGAWPRIKADVR
jgi:hypothetical protein